MIFRRLNDSDVGRVLPRYDAYEITVGGAWAPHASKLKGKGYAYFMVQQMPCPKDEWDDGDGDPNRGWMNFLNDNKGDLILLDRTGREAVFPHNWFPCRGGARRLIGWHRWTDQHIIEGASRVQECCNRYGTKLTPFLDMFFRPAPWMLDDINGPGWEDFDPEIWSPYWTNMMRFHNLLRGPSNLSHQVWEETVVANGEREWGRRIYLENAQRNLERDMEYWIVMEGGISLKGSNILSVDPRWAASYQIVLNAYRPHLWLAFDPVEVSDQAYVDLEALDTYWRARVDAANER